MSNVIIEQLKIFISNDLNTDIKMEDIHEDTTLFEEGLGLDSITILELIVHIEKKYNFTFTDEKLDIELFKDLRTIANFIEEKLNSGVSIENT